MAEAEQQVCSFFLQGKCKRKKGCPFAHPIIEVQPEVQKVKVEKKVVEKPKKSALDLANEAVTEQGERVRELKAKKAAKPEIEAAVAQLLAAKNKVKELGGGAEEKKDDKKKGKEAPKAVGGGVKSNKKKKKDEEEGDDEEEQTPAAATPAPAAEKPAAKSGGGDKKPKEKTKKEETPAAATEAPAAEQKKGGKKEKGGKAAAETPAPVAEKAGSRKPSSADEPAKPAAKASRKQSNLEEPVKAEKAGSRKSSSADEPVKAKAGSRKPSSADEPVKAKAGSRKTSSADEAKGGKKSRSNSNLNNDDEKAIKAAQRAPVDLNDPFLVKYKTFSDSAVLGKKAPALDTLKYLGDAKTPGRDVPLALVFWSVYYTGGYKFLPLYSDLNKAFKGKINVLGVSIDPDISAPKKWIEDPDKKILEG